MWADSSIYLWPSLIEIPSMPKKSHKSAGLTKANRELTAAALRILDAHAKFGLALIGGEEPIRPPLRPKSPVSSYETTN
jgi:hypothetical protein